MSARPAIAAYISSHGFGHATRCLEVLRHIPLEIDLEIVGTLPDWLIDSSLQRPYRYHELLHDCGLVQTSCLEQDIPATAERWSSLFEAYPRMAEAEATRLQATNVRVVLGDISPFSRAVADRLQVSHIIIANFSWDWILAPYIETVPAIQPIIETMSGLFSRCDLLLRTPLDGDLSVFPRETRVPLVARAARLSRCSVRKQLGVPEERKLLLISFGGHEQAAIPGDVWERFKDYTFLMMRDGEAPAPNVISLAPQAWHHPDLMGAVDGVVGKLGYGLVGEALCHQTPILYVERHGFPETQVMEETLPKYLSVARITQQDFQSGSWHALEELLQTGREHLLRMDTNGGEAAAQRLCETVQSGSVTATERG